MTAPKSKKQIIKDNRFIQVTSVFGKNNELTGYKPSGAVEEAIRTIPMPKLDYESYNKGGAVMKKKTKMMAGGGKVRKKTKMMAGGGKVKKTKMMAKGGKVKKTKMMAKGGKVKKTKMMAKGGKVKGTKMYSKGGKVSKGR